LESQKNGYISDLMGKHKKACLRSFSPSPSSSPLPLLFVLPGFSVVFLFPLFVSFFSTFCSVLSCSVFCPLSHSAIRRDQSLLQGDHASQFRTDQESQGLRTA
jgi:hypothetical protein